MNLWTAWLLFVVVVESVAVILNHRHARSEQASIDRLIAEAEDDARGAALEGLVAANKERSAPWRKS
jgi:hypothetical protein